MVRLELIDSVRSRDSHVVRSSIKHRAKLCPTPKTCRLQFRVIVNNQTSPEYLPIVWKMADNVRTTPLSKILCIQFIKRRFDCL